MSIDDQKQSINLSLIFGVPYCITFKYTSISVLNAFIAKLDERHEKNRGSCWVEGKRKATGSPSKRPPPEGCPPAFVKTVLLPALEVPAAAAEAQIEQDDSDFNPNI